MKRVILIVGLLIANGLAAQTFDGLNEAIEGGSFGNLKAVVISRHGEIIFEQYYRGSHANTQHQVQSVTKSVGSALIGIAHRQGYIHLDQGMDEFFQGLYPMDQGAYANKTAITVENVLQQRTGISWDEVSTDYRDPANSVGQMILSADWYQYVLTQAMSYQPGEDFTYSSGVSTLMSRLIRVSTGVGPAEFAMQALFEPLDILPVHWELYSAEGMGHGMTDWPNPDDDPSLGFSLWLRARDMVKFGELYLNGGVYEGRRILDKAWVDSSWSLHSHSGNSSRFTTPGTGHGYQWWITKMLDDRGRAWHVYFASGWGSQVIFVVPELNLVVVTTADNYDHAGDDVDVLLNSWVLPELVPVLDSRFNGSWFDPATDGQGFALEILERRGSLVSQWYTYTDGGEQRWFLLQGPVTDGVGEAVIYETSGGVFLQANPVTLTEWGSGRFVPRDCNHLDFEFTSDIEGVAGSIPLSRLSGTCYTPPSIE